MAGILAESTNGGLQTRDASGNPIAQPTVQNAYNPPAAFTTSCSLNYLPSDCTARISAAQINAITAELICFMSSINPTGSYNCGSTCNLATNFAAWQAANGKADGTTIGGVGTTADPYKIIPAGVVAAICANDAAADALAACVRSATAGNLLAVGADGRLYASLTATLAPACMDYTHLIGLGTDGVMHRFPKAQVHTGTYAFNSGHTGAHAIDTVLANTTRLDSGVITVNNPDPCDIMVMHLTGEAATQVQSSGNGSYFGALILRVNGLTAGQANIVKDVTGRALTEVETTTLAASRSHTIAIPAGGSATYQWTYADESLVGYPAGSSVQMSLSYAALAVTT